MLHTIATKFFLSLFLCFYVEACLGQNSIFGFKGYTEYRPGDPESKIIISAPHGGYLDPDDIPDREDGCFIDGECVYEHNCGVPDEDECGVSVLRDAYTQELSGLIVEELTQRMGIRPHHIISHLWRRKMDPNRSKEEGTHAVPDAEQAWDDFHGFLDEARAVVSEHGLLLDIHGHGHDEQWVELGYLMSSTRLNNDDLDPDLSSIRALYYENNVSFEELLRGATSFGGRLEDAGYVSVPAPDHPGPHGGGFFSGGYITRYHGSRYEGTIDAIQIESPRTLRNEDASPEYAAALAEVTIDFMEHYYP